MYFITDYLVTLNAFSCFILKFPFGYEQNLLKLTKLVNNKICLDLYHIYENISSKLQFLTITF